MTFPFPFALTLAGGSPTDFVINYIGTANAAGTITYTDAPVGPAAAERLVVVPLAREANGSSTTSVVAGGVSLTLLATTNFVGTVQCIMEIWCGLVPTGTTATVVATLAGASTAQIFVYTVYGCLEEPLYVLIESPEEDTVLELDNILVQEGGGVLAFMGCYSNSVTGWTGAWSGSEAIIEDFDDGLAGSTNARLMACHFDTDADSLTNDFTGTINVSRPHTGIIVSFGQTPITELAHRYHRFFYTESISGDPGISIAEILVRETAGGANISGGTWTADSEYSGSNTAAHARDGNASTFWATSTGAPWWQKVDWGVGVTKFLAEFVLTVRNDGYRNVDPKIFKAQVSHDDITWHDVWAPATQTTWTNGETRTFTKP